MGFSSVFEEKFDVAVYGTGYAGIAAALSLEKAGRKVLLFDRRFDVAWESGRSFAVQSGEHHSELWTEFLRGLQERSLYDGTIIDGAGAEVMVAARLRELRPRIQTLLGAWPVEIGLEAGAIRELTVATKSGLRTISADFWIDASDEMPLLRLMAPQSTLPEPAHYEYRAILLHKDAAAVEQVESGAVSESVFLERRLWSHEFTLGIKSPEKLRLSELVQRAEEERARLPEPLQQAALIAFSVEPLPVFEREIIEEAPRYPNLFTASPAFQEEEKSTLGARFQAGIEAAQRLEGLETAQKPSSQVTDRKRLPEQKRSCDILVAGAGTAGALAALAASRDSGGELKVLCADAISFAGGVGSGGLITGYFHGQSGGLFESFDEQAQQLGAALSPDRPSRSHETKKIVFEREFLRGENNCFLTGVMPFEVKVEDGAVRSVTFATQESIIKVEAKAIIDATGDGDLAALAGAKFQMGRQEDGFPLSYSQPSLIAARSKGAVATRFANFDAGWTDPTDPEDLTRARLTAITQYDPCEFSEEFHLILLAPLLGLRQSRQIATEETLTLKDLLGNRSSPSSIGQARSPLDTHSIDYEFEDDETLFWLWGCKSFREVAFADMPYGITVAKNFRNLWIAGRAAGITPAAAYAARMQRDMQRVGEAAGYAAVISLQRNIAAKEVPLDSLQAKLRVTGALGDEESSPEQTILSSKEELLLELDRGIVGAYLWRIYQDREEFEEEVLQRLSSGQEEVSWLAASLLSMWKDSRAEPRLIQAITTREEGGETPASARGPFGQWIDVPNWFLAINLLRRCGSGNCLPALHEVAAEPHNILNLRTSIALTLARLAPKFNEQDKEEAASVLELLLEDAIPDGYVRPSRSLYRALKGEEQKRLPQEPEGVDTREDHSWRLDFAVAKSAQRLGIELPEHVVNKLNDERALVRRAFREFC